MTQAKSQSEAPQASFSLKDPLTWGVLGAFALSSFLSVSLLTQLSRGTQEEGARRSTQLVLGLGGAFGTWPLLLGALGVVAGSGLLFVQPRRLRGVPAALAILGALLTLSFAVSALSPGSGGAVSGWLAGAGAFGRIAAFAAAVVLGLGTVLAGFEALGLDSSGIRGSLRRLTAVGNLSALGAAIASRTKRAPQESSPTATGQLPLDEDTEDSHAIQPARRSRPSQPEPAVVPEPAGEQPAGSNLAGAAGEVEDRDVVRPLSRRPGSVAAQPARTAVDVPQPASPGALESGEPKPHVAAGADPAPGAGESDLDDLVVRHVSPAATEKRPVIEPDLGETHEPRAMSTNAVEAAATRVGQRTEDPNPGPMEPIASEDPKPLFAEAAQGESAAAVAEPPRVSGNTQRVEELESEWAEVEALIATPTAELVEPAEAAAVDAAEPEAAEAEAATEEEQAAPEASTATAPEVEEAETDSEEGEWEEDGSAELEDGEEEWEESDDDGAEEDVEEGAWDEAEGAEEGDEEEWEEGDEEEGEWDSAEGEEGEWEESEEGEWEEEPAAAEASAEAEEGDDEEWEEEEGEDEEWDESAEWEEGEEEAEEEEAEEPAVAELEEAPEEAPEEQPVAAEGEAAEPEAESVAAAQVEEPVSADVTTAESLTQNDLFGDAAGPGAEADPDPTPAPLAAEEPAAEEPAEVAAEAASEPIVELQPAAPDRERLIREAGLMFIRAERVAVSMLQRTYDMDFEESTAILDELQQRGLIGPYMGGKQRDILMDEASWSATAAG